MGPLGCCVCCCLIVGGILLAIGVPHHNKHEDAANWPESTCTVVSTVPQSGVSRYSVGGVISSSKTLKCSGCTVGCCQYGTTMVGGSKYCKSPTTGKAMVTFAGGHYEYKWWTARVEVLLHADGTTRYASYCSATGYAQSSYSQFLESAVNKTKNGKTIPCWYTSSTSTADKPSMVVLAAPQPCGLLCARGSKPGQTMVEWYCGASG